MQRFSQKDLEMMQITKGGLVKIMGLENYDTALPQNWLDWFVKESGLDYYLVLGTTVWSYDDCNGKPVSGCVEVQAKIDALR